MQQLGYLVLFAFAGILGLFVSRYVYYEYDANGSKDFGIALFSITLWSWNSFARMLVTDSFITQLLLANSTALVLMSAYFWLRFTSEYTGKMSKDFTPLKVVVSLLIVSAYGLGLTNQYHHLYWTQIEAVSVDSSFIVFIVGKGIGHHISMFTSYLCYFVGIYFLASLNNSTRSFESVSLVLLSPFMLVSANLLPYVVNIAVRHPTTITPLGASLALGFSGVAVRRDLLQISPIAIETTFNNLAYPTVVVDMNENVVDYNKRFEAEFAGSSSITGTEISSVVPELYGEISFEDEVWEEKVETTVDGDKQFYSIRTAPVIVGTNLIGHSVFIRDVTELEQSIAEVERHNKHLEEFSDSVAHELRNPLTIVRGHAGLVEERADDDEIANYGGTIHEHTVDMELIIDDFLRTINSAQSIENAEYLRFSDVVDSASEEFDTDEIDVTVESDGMIHADSTRLVNLLSTVFRFASNQGQGRMFFSLEDDGFRIELGDNPVDADVTESLLEYGYTTKFRGEGLGLSIAKTLAETHYWDISIESTESEFAVVVTDVDTKLE